MKVKAKVSRADGLCMNCWNPDGMFKLELTITNAKKAERVKDCTFCLEEALPEVEEELLFDDFFCGRDTVKKANIKHSRKREKECAEQISGRTTPASGAFFTKGDARNDEWMVEDKFTNAATYTLNRRVMEKALADAAGTNRKAVIRIGVSGVNLAVVHWSDFLELIGANK